jgi:hypothetical protein
MLITPTISLTPPQGYKLEPVNTEQNQMLLREQLQDCGHLSYLVTKFEEKYIWLEVQSVWLIWILKEGNGIQDWHQDLACNGQTVYTVIVNLGSFEIQADTEEINKDDIDTIAYAADIQPPTLMEIMKASPMVMMKQRQSKGLSHEV